MGAKILKEKNVFLINGKEYPATIHNLEVWKKYRETGDENVLSGMSEVVLDI